MNPTSVSGLFSRERMELDGNETFSSLSLSLLGTIPREALFISNETIMMGDFYREINPSLFPIPKRNRVKFESNDRLYDRRAKRAARKSVDFKRPALECLYGNFSGKRACRKPMKTSPPLVLCFLPTNLRITRVPRGFLDFGFCFLLSE